MSLLLTTPHIYDPGSNLPIETLNEVRISFFGVDILSKDLLITAVYGNTVNGVWIMGNAPAKELRIQDKEGIMDPTWVPDPLNPEDEPPIVEADPAFSMLVGLTMVAQAHVGLRLYDVVGVSLYQLLIDQGYYAGTIQP